MTWSEQGALEILGDASIASLLSLCSFQPAGAVSVLFHGYYQSWRLHCCGPRSSSTSSPPCSKPTGSPRGQWVTPTWVCGCWVLQWRHCNPASVSVFVLTVSLGGILEERGLALCTYWPFTLQLCVTKKTPLLQEMMLMYQEALWDQ